MKFTKLQTVGIVTRNFKITTQNRKKGINNTARRRGWTDNSATVIFENFLA